MQRMYGGKWISMLAIPPLTPIFIVLVFVTVFMHRAEVRRRYRRQGSKANKTIIESWF